mmetsp:Transcript_48157/g.43174  ORF Transcript_48157/g.43174 Transcript_48157/m.43174 type:complete len:509 (-) Transcript_48157:168-1694(-)
MLSVVLAFMLGAVTAQPSPGRRISITEIITNTQAAQKSYEALNQVQFTADAQQQYDSSGMTEDESPISQSTLLHLADQCKTPSIHKKVEDHVFMGLFENINDGCTQVQDIWSKIPTITNQDHLDELINNISYAIQNKTFNESVKYGIPEDVIITITTWLEDGLEAFHPDLPYDVGYHIYRWLLQRKFDDNDYFTDKCDFVNNDPVDIFTNIEPTLSPVRDCVTSEVVHYNKYQVGIPKLNCTKILNKNFVIALEFQIQLSFILGVNGGIGIGVELKSIAEGELFWQVGGGLSLFIGFNIGVGIPYVNDLKYLNGGTIKIGGGIVLGIMIEAHAVFNEKFSFVGYELDFGLGINSAININLEFIYRKNIKQFMVNMTKICQSKTLPPQATLRPANHPTLRPNSHPTHKPVKVPTRDPSHPTPSPSHPTFRPPENKEADQTDKGDYKHGHKDGHKHGSHERHARSYSVDGSHNKRSGSRSSSSSVDGQRHHGGHSHDGKHHGHHGHSKGN